MVRYETEEGSDLHYYKPALENKTEVIRPGAAEQSLYVGKSGVDTPSPTVPPPALSTRPHPNDDLRSPADKPSTCPGRIPNSRAAALLSYLYFETGVASPLQQNRTRHQREQKEEAARRSPQLRSCCLQNTQSRSSSATPPSASICGLIFAVALILGLDAFLAAHVADRIEVFVLAALPQVVTLKNGLDILKSTLSPRAASGPSYWYSGLLQVVLVVEVFVCERKQHPHTPHGHTICASEQRQLGHSDRLPFQLTEAQACSQVVNPDLALRPLCCPPPSSFSSASCPSFSVR